MPRSWAAWIAGGLMAGSALIQPAAAAVLHPITVDGTFADWNDVLADPLQRANDGPGAGLIDRDAPVQSTGRDLITFAWTYDRTYLYFYVGRAGNASNLQQFWFYVDTGADGRMGTGEPVIGVAWTGSNRRTDISLYSYTASAAGGDALADAAGFADGWDMPGRVTLLRAVENLFGGNTPMSAMESRISWANLGVPYASPVFFHVASSNSTNLPSQIDDNMGGPGGRVGSLRIAAIALAPNAASTIVPAGFGVLAHTVTNTGAAEDVADLAWAPAGGAFAPTSVSFYRDANGNGLLDAGDTLLADGTGDGRPDTGALAAGASLRILAVPQAPAGPTDGQTATLTVTASSASQPPVGATVTDTLTVSAPRMTLLKSVSATSAAPGSRLTYTVAYTSVGRVPALQAVLVDAIPAPAVYVPGSASGTAATIQFSHDGGVSFDGSEAAPVTHIRWALAASLAPGATGTVSFQADIP